MSSLRLVTDELIALGCIGDFQTRSPKHPQFIDLNQNQIFIALVDLYALHFRVKWRFLHPLITPGTNTTNAADHVYLARVYISHWFISLYALNREATFRHGYSDHYTWKMPGHSEVLYNYLTLLLDSLKPTHIRGLPADTLYIPVITRDYNWTSPTSNFFNINNFTLNLNTFRSLIHFFESPASGWLTSPVSSDITGGPFWLLDWHDEEAFAWFPAEENYDKVDITLAFILGVPCTPLLTFRDEDRPRQYPGNRIPMRNQHFEYERAIPTRLHSMCDYRVVENFTYTHPRTITAPALQATKESQATDEEQPVPTTTRTVEYEIYCYKIVDYKYYAKVIRKPNVDLRTQAHSILIFS